MFNECIECQRLHQQLEEKERTIHILQNNLYELKAKLLESDNLVNVYLNYKQENLELKKELESVKKNNLANFPSKQNYELELLRSKYLKEVEKNKTLAALNSQLNALNESRTKNDSNVEIEKLKKELTEKDKQINYQNNVIDSLRKNQRNDENEFDLKSSKEIVDGPIFAENKEMIQSKRNNEELKELINENEYLKKKYQRYLKKYLKFKFKYKELNRIFKIMSKSSLNHNFSDYSFLQRKRENPDNIEKEENKDLRNQKNDNSFFVDFNKRKSVDSLASFLNEDHGIFLNSSNFNIGHYENPNLNKLKDNHKIISDGEDDKNIEMKEEKEVEKEEDETKKKKKQKKTKEKKLKEKENESTPVKNENDQLTTSERNLNLMRKLLNDNLKKKTKLENQKNSESNQEIKEINFKDLLMTNRKELVDYKPPIRTEKIDLIEQTKIEFIKEELQKYIRDIDSNFDNVSNFFNSLTNFTDYEKYSYIFEAIINLRDFFGILQNFKIILNVLNFLINNEKLAIINEFLISFIKSETVIELNSNNSDIYDALLSISAKNKTKENNQLDLNKEFKVVLLYLLYISIIQKDQSNWKIFYQMIYELALSFNSLEILKKFCVLNELITLSAEPYLMKVNYNISDFSTNSKKIRFHIKFDNELVDDSIIKVIFNYITTKQDDLIINFIKENYNQIPNEYINIDECSILNFTQNLSMLRIIQILYFIFNLKDISWIYSKIFEELTLQLLNLSQIDSLKRTSAILIGITILFLLFSKDPNNQFTLNLINWAYNVYTFDNTGSNFSINILDYQFSHYDKFVALYGFLIVSEYNPPLLQLAKDYVSFIKSNISEDLIPLDLLDLIKKIQFH